MKKQKGKTEPQIKKRKEARKDLGWGGLELRCGWGLTRDRG